MALIRAFLGAASDPSAGGGGSGGFTPNQALGAQPAFFIDGSNVSGLASNSNDGLTLLTPLLTRGEYYRRMFGVTLTVNQIVTIMSDLLAGDIFQSEIITRLNFSLNWVGLPTSIFTGAVTQYVVRNGATSQITQMAIATIPVSWTASGLVGKIIEFDNGAGTIIRSIVLADLGNLLAGEPTAQLSPPINQLNIQDQVFVVGKVINVWQLRNFQSFEHTTEFSTYKYLSSILWEIGWGRIDQTSCIGATLQFGGNNSRLNCSSLGGGTNRITSIGAVNINGGINSFVMGANSSLQFSGHSTVNDRLQLEDAANCTSGGQGGIPADIEYQGASIGIPMVLFTLLAGGKCIFEGFVYGTSLDPTLIEFDARDATCSFTKLPNVTGANSATNIQYVLAGKTAGTASLTLTELADTFNNRVIGPYGQEFNREENWRFAQGIIAETTPRCSITAGVVATSGTLFFQQVFLKQGDLLVNCHVINGVAAIAETFARIGLYDIAGNLLASCVDQGAAWATLGIHSQPFSTPFSVPTTGIYYLALLTLAATSPGLAIIQAPAATRIGLAVGLVGKPIQDGSQNGLIDLPNPMVVAAGPTPGIFWIAVGP